MRAEWRAWAEQEADELERRAAQYFDEGPASDLPAEGLEALEAAEAALRRLAGLADLGDGS